MLSETLIGETIEYNDKRYIIVAETAKEYYIFDEEVAKTAIVHNNEKYIFTIKKSELGLEELEENLENEFVSDDEFDI